MTSTPDVDLPLLVARLRAVGCVWAEDEVALLLAEARTPDHLEALVARREQGVPLEVVVGWADFAGVRVPVEPGVFVPRARSALLVRLAVEALGPRPDAAVVVDLGCGTGALGAAVAAARPGVEVWAVDVDPAAVRCARQVLPPDRVLEGDLYDALPAALVGRVAVLLANAPYVPTAAVALMPPEARLHERRQALDGGSDGLDEQRRVLAGAARWLAPDGLLLVETSRGQAPDGVVAAASAGLETRVVVDDDLDATVLAVRSTT
ncbi:putative protein N(5)-glutamine methyltransferase [Nocardioides sp. AX2bis]|uniref:putative protein N(5)-glutamine methyltransferase n=1 Tax=Nocardioides sp. AX2bis TaxID=2653157 RepID=UPI00135A9A9B|nr:putative protein N(5)-glutamine methyltransferase [Nocardioides sp. AX2bis]